LFYDYLSEKSSRSYVIENNTEFNTYLESSLDRMTENEMYYSVYFFQDEYRLNKDGKIYRKWLGD